MRAAQQIWAVGQHGLLQPLTYEARTVLSIFVPRHLSGGVNTSKGSILALRNAEDLDSQARRRGGDTVILQVAEIAQAARLNVTRDASLWC